MTSRRRERVTRRGHAVAKPLAGEALLVVVELDVRLVQQAHKERESEVAVRALQEREARVPAVQVALQLDDVLAELFGVDIVGRGPRRRPVLRGAERQSQRELLLASLRGVERAHGVGARPDAGPRVGDGQVDPSPTGTGRELGRRPAEGSLINRATGQLTRQLAAGLAAGSGAGSRRRRALSPAQAEQAPDATDRCRSRSEEHTSELQSLAYLVC